MNKKFLGILIPLTLTVSLLTMPAKAGEWEMAIGLKGHDVTMDTSGSEREGNRDIVGASNSEELIKTTVSKDFEAGSIFVEFAGRSDDGAGMGGLTAGFEWVPGDSKIGTKSRTDTDLSGGSEGGTSKTYTGSAQVENHVTFYLEPTLYVSDAFGLYLKGGATTVQVETLEDISSGTNSSIYGNTQIWGGVIGAGIRYKAPFGLLVKLEYTETNYQPVTFESDTGNRNRIKAELESEVTTLGIGWQF